MSVSMNMPVHAFDVSVEVNKKTGKVIAAYFTIRLGKSAETREFANGRAFADYGENGELLGVELLGKCQVKVLNKIPGKDLLARKFIRSSAPRELIRA